MSSHIFAQNDSIWRKNGVSLHQRPVAEAAQQVVDVAWNFKLCFLTFPLFFGVLEASHMLQGKWYWIHVINHYSNHWRLPWKRSSEIVRDGFLFTGLPGWLSDRFWGLRIHRLDLIGGCHGFGVGSSSFHKVWRPISDRAFVRRCWIGGDALLEFFFWLLEFVESG